MLGDTIRMFRLERNLSPEDLAEAIDISPMAIHYYEENKWRPGTDVLVRLASAFKVSLTELVEGCSILYTEKGEMLIVRNIGGNHIKVVGRVSEELQEIYRKEVEVLCGNK
ncbi:helix-turn-helix domain-containing protein [Pelosinus baikalensis]|uniref:Helix-turn-helix transcriptional regulator n=1 Tax=Pelosinus baikalensis TaxID=2892015 RepID=A0ABS8HU23_9FIRM|nr:helix-turn-helix transcriptional regulator [Pelosinus baikalensis]MCC5466585.1 helix-turn-helix transcriptional regulator [Pelosinus baikalensis]